MSKRNNCQIFTPIEIVKEMLDNIEFTENIFGKKVLENSFGEGNFLAEIIERYISDGLSKKIPLKTIKKNIEENIIGIEFDIEKLDICKQTLDALALNYKLKDVKWNLINGDSLKINFNFDFDFVIGNPPYITYADLSEEDRLYIKQNYETCIDGKPDYYYAFIEKSINSLNNKGILTYIIPNNIYKNKFANKIREFIKPMLTTIIDYGSIKLFEKKLVSSTIIICKKDNDINSKIRYLNKDINEEKYIFRNNLLNKWCFGENNIPANSVRFGDYFHAACGVATLLNEAFVLKDYVEQVNEIINQNQVIELAATRIAVSPRSLQYNRNERIIFPYFYNNEGFQRYEDNVFEANFPSAIAYLRTREAELLARDSDNNARWFEFGRSQALRHLNQKKLLMSTIITKKVYLYELSNNVIPYSGIYIVNINESFTLDDAKLILKSEKFMEYIKSRGINASGESLRISSTDINDYMFILEV